MAEFDPYEGLLRNFSKHKFKAFVEHTILDLSAYPPEHVPDAGEVQMDRWETHDLAEMDMPTRMGLMFGITSFNRWIFRLDHTDDGLIKPDMIWEYAQKRIIELAEGLAEQRRYIKDLQAKLYDRIGHTVSTDDMYHDPIYGAAIFYYLTNAQLDPFSHEDEYKSLHAQACKQLRDLFHNAGRRFGIDLSKAEFDFGFGSPTIFLHQERDSATSIIRRIDARPDVVSIEFREGRFRTTCSNKRLLTAYDAKQPRIVLLNQVVDPLRYFTNEQVQEFENLLNKPGLRESELQAFLEAQPAFLLYGDYDEIRPQVTLADETGKELKPDFFLRPTGRKLWEILDIKLPDVPLTAGPANREGLSFHVHRGMSQLMNYSRFFDNPRNREKVFRETGIDCFKPSLTLVIGKKSNIDETIWNQIIEQERPFARILGFDEMIERAKRFSLKLPD